MLMGAAHPRSSLSVRMRPSAARVLSLTLFAALLAGAAPAARAQRIDTLVKGHLLADLTAKRDTSDHYAAYIPTTYHDSVPAPLLLVLDPQGRALDALAGLAPTLERLGWVGISSYDTHGDAPAMQNEKVANVMLSDAFTSLDLDTSRIYLAGLSGMANDAWVFAFGSGGHIAGIISAEGAMPADSAWRAAHAEPPGFAVALVASRVGFAFDEIVALERQLAAESAVARVDVSSGGPGWPSDSTMSRILGWFEVRAMARGMRPVDLRFVDSLYAMDSTAAAALESARQPAHAADAWRRMAVAWAGAHDVSYPDTRSRALAAEPAVARWQAERDSLAARDPAERASVIQTLVTLRKTPGVPDLRKLSDELRIAQFEGWMADSTDSVRAEWARRRLSEIYTHVSYYEPEAYLGVGDAARALAVLSIAAEIHPDSPEVCRERARADALRRDSDRTMAELRCALAGHTITVQEIRADPRYQFMTKRDDYLALIGMKKR